MRPWIFSLFTASAAVVYLSFAAMKPKDPESGFQFAEFARLPVQENGRLMPFDTFARTKLMLVSHRQNVRQEVYTNAERAALQKDENERTPREKDVVDEIDRLRDAGRLPTRVVPAVEWAVYAMCLNPEIGMRNNPFHDMHSFRIDNDELLQFLEIKPSRQFGLFFKPEEFLSNGKFMKQAKNIAEAGGPQKENLLDNKIADLYQKAGVVYRLVGLDVPFLFPPKAPRGADQKVADTAWLNLPTAFSQGDPRAAAAVEMLEAVANNHPAKFNAAVKRNLDSFEKDYPGVVQKNDWEIFFNNFAPYYQCIILFTVVLILTVLSWIVWPETLRTAAWTLGALTMVVYTAALVLRIYISGYAPVTNLYSSAVFIGWGCALLCLGLEWVLRNGIGIAVAATTGIMALIVAHNLLDGDSMGKLVAVLESNFWLSTHVICITFGYTATFVAGFLAIVYVLAGLSTNALRGENGRLLSKVIYGVVCFALFLSFVGTVLGGIWADQSWGRFWGWDPKENGALLIVIWNAIILHARWGGMVKSRGVALLAIFGNAVTAWSWFGTNLLGVGLHSYGFMKGAMIWLGVFVISQLLIIGLGLTPLDRWRSFRKA